MCVCVSLVFWDCACALLLLCCQRAWSLVRAFLNDKVYLSVLWYVHRKVPVTARGGRKREPQQVAPPHRTKCHLFPGWLTQPSPWKEQTFKTLWHVSETLPLSQCRWCSPNWQHRSRRSWLGDVASLVSVTSHPRHGLVSNSSANINSIRREAQVQRVDICCHACVLRVSERMRQCVCCAGGTG